MDKLFTDGRSIRMPKCKLRIIQKPPHNRTVIYRDRPYSVKFPYFLLFAEKKHNIGTRIFYVCGSHKEVTSENDNVSPLIYPHIGLWSCCTGGVHYSLSEYIDSFWKARNRYYISGGIATYPSKMSLTNGGVPLSETTISIKKLLNI